MIIDILLVFIKTVVFHHVGLSCLILTKEQYEFSVEEHFIEWCTGGPLFNETIYCNLHGPIFEECFFTAWDRYYLMCGFHAYDKENYKSTYAANFGGRSTIPDDSTTIYLVSICIIINFIDTWLNVLEINFLWRCCSYQEKMK